MDDDFKIDSEYSNLKKLVLNTNRKKVRKSVKNAKKEENIRKNENKTTFGSKRIIAIINSLTKLNEKPIIRRPLTIWSQRHITMLKECFVCHRWKSAAKILNLLTYEPDRTSEIIWMAGFQIFCNHPNSNYDLLNQFHESMNKLDKIFPPASILKNIMILLLNNDFTTAKLIFQNDQILKKIKEVHINDRQRKIMLILHGYKAMFKYIDWVSSEYYVNDEVVNENDMEIDNQREYNRKITANAAIFMFEEIFIKPGEWDIFILKYIELSEYVGEIKHCLQTLEEYCKLNPLNPNSYIYLYDFISKHFTEQSDQLIRVLRSLVLLKPGDKRILDLPRLQASTNYSFELSTYFNMVDHPESRNNPKAWKTLANCILKLYKRPSRAVFEKLRDLWTDRSDWWPEFHFATKNIFIHSKEEADLHLNKAIVFTSLTTADNKYAFRVKKKLSRHFEDHVIKLEIAINFFKKLDVPDDATISGNLNMEIFDSSEEEIENNLIINNDEDTIIFDIDLDRSLLNIDSTRLLNGTRKDENSMADVSFALEEDDDVDLQLAVNSCIKVLESPMKKNDDGGIINGFASASLDLFGNSDENEKKSQKSQKLIENGNSSFVSEKRHNENGQEIWNLSENDVSSSTESRKKKKKHKRLNEQNENSQITKKRKYLKQETNKSVENEILYSQIDLFENY